MFSELGPLFKTTFRQAESNDTRQKIPHEERDHPNKNKNNDTKQESDDDLWQDSTTVSLEALRNFLINFMATLPGAQETDIPLTKEETPKTQQRPKEKNRPTSTHNAKAVRAYQSMAAHNERQNTAKRETEPTYRKPPSADQIENRELRDIYQLIDNLDYLANKGVQDITILKSGNFLESLQASIQRLL